MKQRFLITFTLLFTILTTGFSQIVGIEYILNQEVEQTESFDNENLKFYQTTLETGFNEFRVQDSATIKKIENKTIYKVELYYSSYKESDDFSQRQLNNKRLAYLQQVLPFVFENNAIEWKLINQIENADKAKAQNLFHGFVFYSRESVIELEDGRLITITTKDEINIIKSELGELLPKDSTTELSKICLRICDSIGVDTLIEASEKKIYSGKYWPNNARRKAKGKLLKRKSIWKREPEYKIQTDSVMTLIPKSDCFGETLRDLMRGSKIHFDLASRVSGFADTVVSKTLNNNYWGNALVVEDVTGSMYPYLTQTFQWRRLKIASTNLDNFAFFNDGDSNPDGKIGKSHGVYDVFSDSINEVEKTAFSTMSKGNGGRGPENDIEAMIRGVDQTEMQVENIVLIADNFARVRDMSILDKLIEKNIPISVIVCGALNRRINYQYIDLARISGGKLFTIEEDIDFTIPLAEGEKVTIGVQTFLITKGKLVLLK